MKARGPKTVSGGKRKVPIGSEEEKAYQKSYQKSYREEKKDELKEKEKAYRDAHAEELAAARRKAYEDLLEKTDPNRRWALLTDEEVEEMVRELLDTFKIQHTMTGEWFTLREALEREDFSICKCARARSLFLSHAPSLTLRAPLSCFLLAQTSVRPGATSTPRRSAGSSRGHRPTIRWQHQTTARRFGCRAATTSTRTWRTTRSASAAPTWTTRSSTR